MQSRQYKYVGPEELKQRLRREPHCIQVSSVADLVTWTTLFLPSGRTRGNVSATFIVDISEQLWIADRHSEHVTCANGQSVLAAGEMTFERHDTQILVSDVTNQSTGYCPEPECWEVIAQVLDRLEISRPSFLTAAFEFRRCDQCGTTNLIKESVFECAVCNSTLNRTWNYPI
jgi:hypothetical protein